MTEKPMSKVEEALRSQREVWRDVVSRTAQFGARDLPREAPKRILLFGIGSSHHAARLCGFALMRDKTRVRIPIVACSSMAIGKEVFPARGDWAFGFSHRGKTAPTMTGLKQCRDAGAFTVLVAGQGVQVTSDYADLTLHTSPIETVEPHTVSFTSSICAVTTLLLPSRAAEEWDALTSVGDPNLDVLRKRAGVGPSVILGEWEAEWIAREGALKLMEMAKIPVRAFGSEEFFHGPRLSRFEGDARADILWHVQMPEDLRTPQIRADHVIGIFGGSALAWVPALVELQWMALAVALNLGLDPDAQS